MKGSGDGFVAMESFSNESRTFLKGIDTAVQGEALWQRKGSQHYEALPVACLDAGRDDNLRTPKKRMLWVTVQWIVLS